MNSNFCQVSLAIHSVWQSSSVTGFSLCLEAVKLLNKNIFRGKTCHILQFSLPRQASQNKLDQNPFHREFTDN